MRLFFLFILCAASVFSENITQIDQLPNSCTCTIEKDEQGRAVKREIKDANNEIVYLEEISYNGKNLTITDYAYHEGKIRHKGVSYYEKNDQGLVTKRILGVGTEKEQIAEYSYTNSGKILTVHSPNGMILHHKYDEDENLIEVKSTDGTIHYTIEYIDNTTQQTDHINHQTIIKQFAKSGYLAKEIFPNGQEIHYKYEDGDVTKIHFPNNGDIKYIYDDEDNLIKVKRYSSDGRMLYEHSYMDFDDEGEAHKESLIYELGEISYELLDEVTVSIQTPYSRQILNIKPSCITVNTDELERRYPLDKIGQLQVDGGFDSLGNPIKSSVNSRNELLKYGDIQCRYDLNGNLIKKITSDKTITYSYDTLNRLSAIAYNDTKILFTYDLQGRRLSKEITRNGTLCKKGYYIYAEDQEIATQDEERNFKQLRVLGKESRAIAIETPKGTFVPIHSFNGNILKLINCSTKEIIDYSNLEPFGSNLKELVTKNPITPWVYASKHYDLESGLVYFGQRYYDPNIKRWLNLDPMGRIQTANLYNYDFNNPLLFIDIDGTSAFSLVMPLLKWGW